LIQQGHLENGLSILDDRSIRAVLVAYASGIDRRDWSLFRSCFTQDCIADYGDFGRWNSSAELTEFMRESHAKVGPTLHRISNIQLTAGRTGVHASSYVDAILKPLNDQGPVHRGIGSYTDQVVRTGSGWKIARREFKAFILE